MIKEISG